MSSKTPNLTDVPTNHLIVALRDRVAALIVWTVEDAAGLGFDPGTVWWDDVEDQGIQAGWNVIYDTGRTPDLG